MQMPPFVEQDPYLHPHLPVIERRNRKTAEVKELLLEGSGSLSTWATGHHFFGRQADPAHWIFREWAPNATGIQLCGSFNSWNTEDPDLAFRLTNNGIWELRIPRERLSHLDEYKLWVAWPGGGDFRLSPWAFRVVQDPATKLFNEQVWFPENPVIRSQANPKLQTGKPLLIYEAHIGMSGEEEKVSSYDEFRRVILPRIHEGGYNAVQLMAIQEHPYYGSFGYHVSGFFAPSSRFGTPDDLRRLIDDAHRMNLLVIMDLVHSHAVKNTLEGPGLFDGKPGMFFHTDHRREHPAWDSLCFDYANHRTLHFLLSNCQYWLTEFGFDGYRFDGITSMLYHDHGLGRSFSSYEAYFDDGVDEDAVVYLTLANQLIHEVHPHALTIAEDMSGMPGLAVRTDQGGIGFDFRLAMGIPDFWIRIIKEKADEEWSIRHIFHELTNKRPDERVISYAESHDQALVGDKTIMFRLADKDMYTHMSVHTPSLVIDRAMALHKMIRLATLCTHGGGYLNFMGNEFGHPEWVDFPREGNDWSYLYARRQWHLADDPSLRYGALQQFDQMMVRLFNENPELALYRPELIHANESDQIMAVLRGHYIFAFNFHPVQSFTDYGIQTEPADYQIVASSDEIRFGGFDRIDLHVILESEPLAPGSSAYQLKAYLPSRTVLILKKIPTPQAKPLIP